MACRLGFNARGMVHYGLDADKQVQRIRGTQPEQIPQTLQRIRDLNGSVVRVYVGNNLVEPEEAAEQLQALLEQASQFDVQVIASLLDLYYPFNEDSWFTPIEPDAYTVPLNAELRCLGPAFFAGGYHDRYLPFVETVVAANSGHKNLFAWQPGNELTTGSSDDFVRFMRDTTDLIQSTDPLTRIAAGVLTATHALNQPPDVAAKNLYTAVPKLHFATGHYYLMNGEQGRLDEAIQDADWALSHGREFVVEELGPTRKPLEDALAMKEQLDAWDDRGAAAVLLWGYHLGIGQEDLFFQPPDAGDLRFVLWQFGGGNV
jgi:hypothetical protein